MTNLLEIREWLRNFYGRFSLYIMAGIRFITMLVIALLINDKIGYMTRLKNPVAALLMAMVCAFLPTNVIALFSAGLILLHLSAVSLELTLITAGLFLIILLVYYRFSPKYAYALLLTPLAFAFKLPFLVPLTLGLVASPLAILPVGFGGIIYFLLRNISSGSLSLLRVEDESGTQAYLYIIENTIKSSEMYLVLVTIMLTVLIVYLIRRMSVDHAWTIAIVTGTLFDLVVLLIGDFVLDISSNIPVLITGSVVSLAIAFILQFFLFSVDYSRTEYVQFEDDEYYYYVKAVPKINIPKRDKKVKRINPQRRERDDRHRQSSGAGYTGKNAKK